MFNVFFYFHLNAQMKYVHDTFKVLQFSCHPNHSIHISLQCLTTTVNLTFKILHS